MESPLGGIKKTDVTTAGDPFEEKTTDARFRGTDIAPFIGDSSVLTHK